MLSDALCSCFSCFLFLHFPPTYRQDVNVTCTCRHSLAQHLEAILCLTCRHWIHLHWDQAAIETLIRQQYPSYLDLMYLLKPGVMRANFARYLVLHL